MVRANGKNCTTKHNMHSEAHEILGTLLSCTGSSWTSSTESTKKTTHGWTEQYGKHWARTLSQISLTLFLRKKDNGIQNIGSFENIWTIHPVGAKIWHARNEEGTQKNMGCGTTGSTIREAHPTGETPATTTANFCVSRRPHTTLVVPAQPLGGLSRKLRGRGNGNGRLSPDKKWTWNSS